MNNPLTAIKTAERLMAFLASRYLLLLFLVYLISSPLKYMDSADIIKKNISRMKENESTGKYNGSSSRPMRNDTISPRTMATIIWMTKKIALMRLILISL